LKVHLSKNNIHKLKSDLLVFTVFANEQLSADLKKIDNNLNGTIKKTFKENEFSGQFGKVYRFNTHGLVTSKSILILGLGDKKEFKPNRCYRAFAAAAKELESGDKNVGIVFELNSNLISSSIEGLFQGSYQFTKYKTGENAKRNFELTLFTKSVSDRTFSRESRKAINISKAVHLARDIVNEPPVYLTPAKLAEISEDVATEGNLAIKVLGKNEIKSAGMNGLYSVSRGSTQPPRFIHFTYTPKKKSKKTVAIVGKGVTFDSGGLCLKPAGSMLTMKMDMAGSAAVVGAMKAIAELKPKYKIHGIIPATENMTGGDAYKPDDVLYALNGKSVEIINTDAEGRIALSDALSYAVNLGVDEIIDLATLTGACIVGLGSYTAGVMGNNEKLIKRILESSENVGEKMWQLPLDDELRKEIKSSIADIKNVGSRWGGAITAALFLENFVSDTPWTHIDIAGPAYLEKSNDVYPAGGTGFAVRTLVNYLTDNK
jgi:leucyl aminopeptidase